MTRSFTLELNDTLTSHVIEVGGLELDEFLSKLKTDSEFGPKTLQVMENARKRLLNLVCLVFECENWLQFRKRHAKKTIPANRKINQLSQKP